MNRRGFLAGMLALGAAPAIARAEALMPVVARVGSAAATRLVIPAGLALVVCDMAGTVLRELPVMAELAQRGDAYNVYMPGREPISGACPLTLYEHLGTAGAVVRASLYRNGREVAPLVITGRNASGGATMWAGDTLSITGVLVRLS